jgi:hypothetical protein
VIAGIAILPSVNIGGLALAMFMLFILFFVVGYNPCFFFLAVKFFPPHLEGPGSGVALMVNAVMNVIVAGAFPSGVQSISGGKSGDVRVGRGVSFIIMGAVTVGISAVLSGVLKLKTWAEVVEEENLAAEAGRANAPRAREVQPAPA